MLQSTDTDRLSDKERSKRGENHGISWKGEIEHILQMDRAGKGCEQEESGKGGSNEGRVYEIMTGVETFGQQCGNLRQQNISGNFEGDPSKVSEYWGIQRLNRPSFVTRQVFQWWYWDIT